MAIELIDKIKPKNNGSFAMVDAEDVAMPDGSRLSEFSQTPVFDLGALGMGALTLPESNATLETDTAEIMAALAKGEIMINVPVSMSGTEMLAQMVVQGFGNGQMWQCVAQFFVDAMYHAIFNIYTGAIMVIIMPDSAVPSGTDGQMLQNVGGTWTAVSVADSAIGTYIDDYIAEALGGEY